MAILQPLGMGKPPQALGQAALVDLLRVPCTLSDDRTQRQTADVQDWRSKLPQRTSEMQRVPPVAASQLIYLGPSSRSARLQVADLHVMRSCNLK